MPRKSPKILNVRPAGDNHQVVTAQSQGSAYRRKPCKDCPWRVDAVGVFPASAFIHSAGTAYDMAQSKFACHQAGIGRVTTCAGFLLRGAEHNLSVRLGRMTGKFEEEVTDGGHELHASYRAMAEANGVPADHPSLALCRGPND